jgi:hypothetical protein
MVLFDSNGQIKKYTSAESILEDFFAIRLDYYEKRRLHLLAVANNQLLRISNKVCLQIGQKMLQTSPFPVYICVLQIRCCESSYVRGDVIKAIAQISSHV